MSTGWSIYITVLTVLNILGCLWLLWWTSQKRAGGTPANRIGSSDTNVPHDA